MRAGETVLVSGASGGVGLALVQIARARGARVVAISSGSKSDSVRAAGADAVVDRAGDIAAQTRAAAPAGIDVVLCWFSVQSTVWLQDGPCRAGIGDIRVGAGRSYPVAPGRGVEKLDVHLLFPVHFSFPFPSGSPAFGGASAAWAR
ncbi:zinc-binding dehydrogenase [Nocardia sp. NPDC004568]|uniref:zinc-binding dehydrogenase n=1 Tax=Nocardia sp. NPDC004568 TaxID=3154551 RepID=UPI0033A46F59